MFLLKDTLFLINIPILPNSKSNILFHVYQSSFLG